MRKLGVPTSRAYCLSLLYLPRKPHKHRPGTAIIVLWLMEQRHYILADGVEVSRLTHSQYAPRQSRLYKKEYCRLNEREIPGIFKPWMF